MTKGGVVLRPTSGCKKMLPPRRGFKFPMRAIHWTTGVASEVAAAQQGRQLELQ
jgi:hypothetical protein